MRARGGLVGVNVVIGRRPAAGTRARMRETLFFALVAAACMVPKFAGLTAQSLWLDEMNVLRYASMPHLDGAFFQAIRQEPHPPLYLVLMWGYAKLFGTSPFVLRLSGAIMGSLAVAAFYFAAAAALGRRTALIAAMLFGLSSIGLYEAQEVRPYSLVFLFAGVSAAWFAEAARTPEPGRSRIARLLAVNLLLCFTHYSGVFLAFAEATVLLALAAARGQARLRAFAVSALLGLTALPALAWMAWTLQVYDPMETANLHWRLLDVISPLRAFFGQFAVLILVLLPLLLVRMRRPRLDRNAMELSLSAVILIVFAEVVAAAFLHPSWMQNKNFYVVFPAGYLLLATMLLKVRMMRTRFGPLLTFLIGAAGLATYLATGYPLQAASYYSPFREQIREAAALVGKLARPQDTILTAEIDINGNHLYLLPTKMYADAIAKRRWRAADVIVLPPPRENAGRIKALKAALAGLKPDGELIIDLPQSTHLNAAENHLLDGALCITEHDLVHHRVIEAGFSPDRCPRRRRVEG